MAPLGQLATPLVESCCPAQERRRSPRGRWTDGAAAGANSQRPLSRSRAHFWPWGSPLFSMKQGANRSHSAVLSARRCCCGCEKAQQDLEHAGAAPQAQDPPGSFGASVQSRCSSIPTRARMPTSRSCAPAPSTWIWSCRSKVRLSLSLRRTASRVCGAASPAACAPELQRGGS